jgi:hypothetical protein
MTHICEIYSLSPLHYNDFVYNNSVSIYTFLLSKKKLRKEICNNNNFVLGTFMGFNNLTFLFPFEIFFSFFFLG